MKDNFIVGDDSLRDKQARLAFFFCLSIIAGGAAEARPIDDIVAEKAKSKIAKCDTVQQLRSIYDEIRVFDCPQAREVRYKRVMDPGRLGGPESVRIPFNQAQCDQEIASQRQRFDE